jgi:TldD protein
MRPAVTQRLDAAFLALPLSTLAGAALERASAIGAAQADFRVDRVRAARMLLGDGAVRSSMDSTATGASVHVCRNGGWGFAATDDLSPRSVVRIVDQAAELADLNARAGGSTERAAEPVHPDAHWSSSYRIDPFEVGETERAALLADWSARVLRAAWVSHALAKLTLVRENKFYADSAGTTTTQQRIRVHPQLLAVGEDDATGASATLRTLGPPTARGWEYLLGDGWDWDAELAELPGELAAKLRARPVTPGSYDLVVDPSHLWLTLHETVGHATELDRALGYEISYAGGTFVRPDSVGSLVYGSPLMTVDADRTSPHGLASVGYDDQGVAAQSWTLVDRGVLTGLQTDRRTAARAGETRSTGCAYAEPVMNEAISRMPNVSLRAAPDGPGVAELIAGVTDGIYLVGSDSWSIDAQRRSFQFTPQRCYRIRGGMLGEQLAGVAYRSETTRLWSALSAVGGPQTWTTFGADLCGKGQPIQAAPVSHGCPATVFSGVEVIHAAETEAS